MEWVWVVVVVLAVTWLVSSRRARGERIAMLEAKLDALGYDPDAPLPDGLQFDADKLAVRKMMDSGRSQDEAEAVVAGET